MRIAANERAGERMKAPLILFALIALSSAQAAEPTGTLTLTCYGTARTSDAKPEPVSMDITVDFAAQMVKGFGQRVATINSANEAGVSFSGAFRGRRASSGWSVDGFIDREQGEMIAVTKALANHETPSADTLEGAPIPTLRSGGMATFYSMKCRPK